MCTSLLGTFKNIECELNTKACHNKKILASFLKQEKISELVAKQKKLKRNWMHKLIIARILMNLLISSLSCHRKNKSATCCFEFNVVRKATSCFEFTIVRKALWTYCQKNIKRASQKINKLVYFFFLFLATTTKRKQKEKGINVMLNFLKQWCTTSSQGNVQQFKKLKKIM